MVGIIAVGTNVVTASRAAIAERRRRTGRRSPTASAPRTACDSLGFVRIAPREARSNHGTHEPATGEVGRSDRSPASWKLSRPPIQPSSR
jgi:hypothetical protein